MKIVGKVWNYSCGCRVGVENSELVKGLHFRDNCGSHKGLPNDSDFVGVEKILDDYSI